MISVTESVKFSESFSNPSFYTKKSGCLVTQFFFPVTRYKSSIWKLKHKPEIIIFARTMSMELQEMLKKEWLGNRSLSILLPSILERCRGGGCRATRMWPQLLVTTEAKSHQLENFSMSSLSSCHYDSVPSVTQNTPQTQDSLIVMRSSSSKG